jgi:hypothetical protein
MAAEPKKKKRRLDETKKSPVPDDNEAADQKKPYICANCGKPTDSHSFVTRYAPNGSVLVSVWCAGCRLGHIADMGDRPIATPLDPSIIKDSKFCCERCFDQFRLDDSSCPGHRMRIAAHLGDSSYPLHCLVCDFSVETCWCNVCRLDRESTRK